MVKNGNKIIFPFLFILFVFTCLEVCIFSDINIQSDFELVFANDATDTFHHNHCREIGIFHEDFFQQSDFSDFAGIQNPSQKIHPGITAVTLKYNRSCWHPPKHI